MLCTPGVVFFAPGRNVLPGCSANPARPMLASLYMSRRMPSVRLSSLQGGQFGGNLLGYTGPVGCGFCVNPLMCFALALEIAAK